MSPARQKDAIRTCQAPVDTKGAKCGLDTIAKGYCLTHYQAWRRFNKGVTSRDPRKIPVNPDVPGRIPVGTRVNYSTVDIIKRVTDARIAGGYETSAYDVTKDILESWAVRYDRGEIGMEWFVTEQEKADLAAKDNGRAAPKTADGQ